MKINQFILKRKNYIFGLINSSKLGKPTTGLNHFTDESKIELNESLISENLPSLNILTSQIKNVPKRVLKNGKIKNINEYYIIKEILCDLEYEITESERNELNSLYEEYEFGK